MNDKKIYYGATILFVLNACYIAIRNMSQGNIMQGILGPVSLLFLLICPLAQMILRVRLGYIMRAFIILFSLAAFQLGTALEWYDKFPNYSFLVHGISGILFTQIGFFIYYIVRGKQERDLKRDWLLAACFALFFCMTVAVGWEIIEFFTYQLTGRDVQHTLDTGVYDTMMDLISCTVGSLFMFGNYLFYVKRDKKSLLVKIVEEFYVLNDISIADNFDIVI